MFCLAKMILPRIGIRLGNMSICRQSSFAFQLSQITIYTNEEMLYEIRSVTKALFTTVYVITFVILRVCNKMVSCREGFLKLVTPEKFIFGILQMYNSFDTSVAQGNIAIVTCLFFDSVHIPLLDWSCNILHVNNLISPSISKNARRMSSDKVLRIRVEFNKSVD